MQKNGIVRGLCRRLSPHGAFQSLAVAGSSVKLTALPYTAYKDVYDTQRWQGRGWDHPHGAAKEDSRHQASWVNKKTPHIDKNEWCDGLTRVTGGERS